MSISSLRTFVFKSLPAHLAYLRLIVFREDIPKPKPPEYSPRERQLIHLKRKITLGRITILFTLTCLGYRRAMYYLEKHPGEAQWLEYFLHEMSKSS